MGKVFRAVMCGLVLAAAGPGAVGAQAPDGPATADRSELRAEVERRFRVLQLSDGVVLTPRRHIAGVGAVEVRSGAVHIDGAAVSGGELRERLDDLADLVLKLSYLPPAELAAVFVDRPAVSEAAPAAAAPATETAAGATAAADERPRNRVGSKVNIGGSVTVEKDEHVTEAVVAVGGSVTVHGTVDDAVVAVGGSVTLEPGAVVRGDVVSVGGRVKRAEGASVFGEIHEVAFGVPQVDIHPHEFFRGLTGWRPFSGWFRLAGTLVRIALVLLLAMLVVLVAARPTERIAERAGRDPWVSGFVGLLAQLLFVPVLVIAVVVLAISIIGIPLLVLVPFAVLSLLVAALMGFSGVALRIGRWVVGTDRPTMLALTVGIVVVAATGLVARLIWLLPAPVAPVAVIVGVLGFFVEYLAWTVGFGAALLTRFGSRGPLPVSPPPVPADLGLSLRGE